MPIHVRRRVDCIHYHSCKGITLTSVETERTLLNFSHTNTGGNIYDKIEKYINYSEAYENSWKNIV